MSVCVSVLSLFVFLVCDVVCRANCVTRRAAWLCAANGLLTLRRAARSLARSLAQHEQSSDDDVALSAAGAAAL